MVSFICVLTSTLLTFVYGRNDYCRKGDDCPDSKSSSPTYLVAAFDFGTTYSGYAFSFRDDPLKIVTNAKWNSGTENLISLKTPTCVLVTPDKKFHSFGFEAENKYLSLAEEKEHHGWLLFRRFKMLLHNNEHLSRETTVKDINGEIMPAKTIFAMSIRYLKNHLLDVLDQQMTGVEERDIKFVLTVPAIWDQNAKQFMREAAVEAGIKDSQLKLSLEPEAASIWCQVEPDSSIFKAGTQYMTVDLGGGTGDVSVHEKLINNTLKELHRASGGPWGGNNVDNNFLEWLTNLFGEETMKRFKKEQMEDYFLLLRDFETKKRKIEAEGKITFRVSASLMEIFNEVENMSLSERAAAKGLGKKLSYTSDKVRVVVSVAKEWFASPINKLISHVKSILAEPRMKNVQTILLVGGFGESKLVQAEMKSRLKNHRVFVPKDPELAVLKGAVRFGHIPDIIPVRIMTFTYGIALLNKYDERKHPASKIVMKNNVKMVDNIFDIFVRIGEEVRVGKEIRRTGFIPNDLQASSVTIHRSKNRNPEYVTDEGCKKLGEMTIDHPEGKTLEDKKLDVTFIFGDTELFVKVKMIKTGREFSKYVNCLN